MRSHLILIAPLLMVGGCKKFDLGSLNVEKYLPKVRFQKMRVERVDFRGMDTNFRFQVENPYPVDLKLASFDYDLALQDSPFLNSASEVGLDLAAGTTSPMDLPARLEFADVLALVKNLQDTDEVDYGLTGTFGVNTPAGKIDVPFDQAGTFPTLKAPKIKPTGIRIANVNLLRQQARIEVDMGITNRAKSHAYGMKDLDWGIDLAGSRVATGVLGDLSVAAGQTETVTLPIDLNLLQLGGTIVNAVTRKQPLDVRLDAGLKVSTPLGSIPLQIDETTNLRPR